MLKRAEAAGKNLPGWGGTQRPPRLIGRGIAAELIIAGDLIDAGCAYVLGVVNEIADDPLSAAVELGARIAANSNTAVRGAKRAIRAGLEVGIAAGPITEADGAADCCGTDEQDQAVRAFLTQEENLTLLLPDLRHLTHALPSGGPQ
jgi:enoyl-CoA hydratase